ncbi:MAG: hypothetical protein IKQ32_05465 [Prevotella sp.]|nr:hypothetical protein [Prevotella sp.]
MMSRIMILCLIAMMPMSIMAQEDNDIKATIDLPETVVLADGQTFEEYLVKQVLANAKPLKKHVRTLRYSVTCKLDKDIDLKQMPHRRTVTFAAKLAGYGQIVSALMEHKVFGITMAEDVLFNNGKITTSNVRMVNMKQELTEKQKKAFLKHDGMMSANVFDSFYDKVRDKAKELQKKRRKKQETDMKYMGSYTLGGRTIYKVRLDNMEVHIADGCWQIKMLDYVDGQNRMHFDFSEVRHNLFLLTNGNAKLYLDKQKWPKGFISMRMTYSYR